MCGSMVLSKAVMFSLCEEQRIVLQGVILVSGGMLLLVTYPEEQMFMVFFIVASVCSQCLFFYSFKPAFTVKKKKKNRGVSLLQDGCIPGLIISEDQSSSSALEFLSFKSI